jgi:hypothetical protein
MIKEGTDERRLLHGCHFEWFDSNANWRQIATTNVWKLGRIVKWTTRID